MKRKINLFIDWIIYLIIVTFTSIIFTILIVYISDISQNGSRLLMKFDIIFGLGLSIIITPIFLVALSWGRFIDDRIRNKPMFLKKNIAIDKN